MNFVDTIFNYCQNNGSIAKINECLKDYTTFKIGGTCDILVFPKDKETLSDILKIIKRENAEYFILGNASNVLICENHFKGVVIITSEMNGYEIREDGLIYAECGLSLTKLAVIAKENSLSGLEFAYGIPATVGGAVYMNAGAYEKSMGDIVISSEYFDLNDSTVKTITNHEHQFAYRNSVFNKNNFIILASVLKLPIGQREDIENLMNRNMSARKEKQPLEYPSAGSTFKRCQNHFTAKLIDECGLKGKMSGGAMVSEKHAGFVINKNNATFDDVISLINIIKTTVYEKTGENIECEVRIIRF